MHLIVGLLFMLVVVVLPGWWVKRVMQRYSHPVDRYPGTGAELARHLLDHCGLEAVVVEKTEHGDHYDPDARAVRLSADNHDRASLTAVTIAAHEVGHAIQHADGYGPLLARTRMVKAVQKFQRVGMLLIAAMPVVLLALRLPGPGLMLLIAGLAALASGIVDRVRRELPARPAHPRQGRLPQAGRPRPGPAHPDRGSVDLCRRVDDGPGQLLVVDAHPPAMSPSRMCNLRVTPVPPPRNRRRRYCGVLLATWPHGCRIARWRYCSLSACSPLAPKPSYGCTGPTPSARSSPRR